MTAVHPPLYTQKVLVNQTPSTKLEMGSVVSLQVQDPQTPIGVKDWHLTSRQSETMEITNELAQAVVNYLATKPYTEVFGLIAELQRQASVKPEEPKKETEDKEE